MLAASTSAAVAIPGYVTVLLAVILVAMVAALALEEVLHAKKSVITSVAAVVAVLLGAVFGIFPDELTHIHNVPVYIATINWEVITIILGASLFVDITSKSGIFSWFALWLTRLSKGDPLRLLVFYGGMTVLFSATLNNVAAMLIVGSLTKVSLDKLGRTDRLLGFLLTEALLTNVGGLLTLISSVPNIIVGGRAQIGYVEFFVQSAPYTLVAMCVTLAMAAFLFDIKPLRTEAEKQEARELVESFEPSEAITSKSFFGFASVMFSLFVVTLSFTSMIPYVRDLGMGFVALAFAAVMMIRFKSTIDKKYAALDWDLLIFFSTLFVVVEVMAFGGVLDVIGTGIEALIGLGSIGGPVALLSASALASSVTDNIPLAAVLAEILHQVPTIGEQPNLWWSVIFGANLGGNITPIGSASTVVGMTIMHKAELNISFFGFVVKAVPFAIVQIALASAYVLLL